MNQALGPGWIDAHLHLADLRVKDPIAITEEARRHGIQFFMQGGYSPEDWQRQLSLRELIPGLLPVFGLHPVWVAEKSSIELEAALDLLAIQIQNAVAVGEMGLDYRPQFLHEVDSRTKQIDCFEKQLELALIVQKPIVLHLVRAQSDALRIFDFFGQGLRGIVHGFTGSASEASAWLERDLFISIGGVVCRPDKPRLEQAVREIPLDRLLIETDSPDQPPPGYLPGENHPKSLIQVAERLAEIKKVSAAVILDKSRENLEKLLYGNAKARIQSAP